MLFIYNSYVFFCDLYFSVINISFETFICSLLQFFPWLICFLQFICFSFFNSYDFSDLVFCNPYVLICSLISFSGYSVSLSNFVVICFSCVILCNESCSDHTWPDQPSCQACQISHQMGSCITYIILQCLCTLCLAPHPCTPHILHVSYIPSRNITILFLDIDDMRMHEKVAVRTY